MKRNFTIKRGAWIVLWSIAVLFVIPVLDSSAQVYLDGRFQKANFTYQGLSFTSYQMSRTSLSDGRIKAKYFARNASKRFESWRAGKQVLVVCAGAFSESWETDSKPHGLCVDHGDIVNEYLHISQDYNGNSLDGLVIVYNGGADAGGIAVKDIEFGVVTAGGNSYKIKDDYSDRMQFTYWAQENYATVFQLPLMYTAEYGKNYGSLFYGDQKERRFLAICRGRDDQIYHLIIDVAKDVYMNRAAHKLKDWIYANGFKRLYGLLVLDTGGKNILYEYMDGYPMQIAGTQVSNATNLLVYYFN